MDNEYIIIKDDNFKQFKFNIWVEKEIYNLFNKIPENYLGAYIVKEILKHKNIKIKRLVITREKNEEIFLHDTKTRTLLMSVQVYLKFMYNGFINGEKSPLNLANFAYKNGIAI